MALDIHKELDDISRRLLELTDIDDTQEDALHHRLSTISAQLRAQKTCRAAIEELKQTRPVRRMTFNLKKLLDGSEASEARWSKLQTLEFNSLIFCLLSFSTLMTVPGDQFDWLLQNVTKYLEMQGFSLNLTESTAMKRTIDKIPRQENSHAFLKRYLKRELDMAVKSDNGGEDEPPQKRCRVECRLKVQVTHI
ncbi:hypothetical protein NA57DRAFT_52760 [Rhizodiscina lignyota]|uniref:Uncharacterized protein n=1 Tax=Rhizodiscina lignyota TaxID=1504668 RepID=A0A9P4IPD9_9PEZI|nr:hypothetical protein NA57DRAFT_52760 [Rhizodiscina lignyota]